VLRSPRIPEKVSAVTSLTVSTTPTVLEITLTATLGIPFLVLVVDYVFRIPAFFKQCGIRGLTFASWA